MRKLFFVILFASIVFLSSCDSISTEQFNELEDQLALIDEYDDTQLLAEIAALEAEITALEDELALIDEYDDTILLADIADLEAEIVALEGQLSLIGATLNNVPATLSVEYGDSLDLLAIGVTAIDAIDGVVTSDIYVNIADTSILNIGDHEVSYSVVDSDGNTATVLTTLTVWTHDSDYEFVVVNDGTGIMITRYKSITDEDIDLVIPDTIGGLPVLIIDSYAFIYKNIVSLVIPDTILEIREYAFTDNYLEEGVVLPSGLLIIGERAFMDCELYEINFPDSLISIGDEAFRSNELTNITIPDSVTYIGEKVFYRNDIESYSISGSSTHLKLVNEALYTFDGTRLIDFPKMNLSTLYDVPEGTLYIDDYAFYDNQLISLTLPSTLLNVGDNSFYSNHY